MREFSDDKARKCERDPMTFSFQRDRFCLYIIIAICNWNEIIFMCIWNERTMNEILFLYSNDMYVCVFVRNEILEIEMLWLRVCLRVCFVIFVNLSSAIGTCEKKSDRTVWGECTNFKHFLCLQFKSFELVFFLISFEYVPSLDCLRISMKAAFNKGFTFLCYSHALACIVCLPHLL